ncbi:hypothetical protein [Trichocoleus sp. FACHB-262]|uniref:hypothetical protein n=1 Tax=Trichocoleus sp. FACHB-262 TaxID=2692869 RepID=UPI0016882D5C|nr:hypothetical protein [Trichocoleus sp. FACHB-262]MBD2121159.1 hypothetical protein [Trichocoleus sp. FACHB-262]
MKRNPFQRPDLKSLFKPLLFSGFVVAVLSLLLDLHGAVKAKNHGEVCQEIVQSRAALSREQLAKLLTVPERDSKSKVQGILKAPFCKLPKLEVRAGVNAEREAYPLEFDPQTWLVILYEGNEYAGYRFSFR